MEKVMEAVKEASISIACCLDEVEDVTQQDLEHIQDQITIIENYFKDIDDDPTEIPEQTTMTNLVIEEQEKEEDDSIIEDYHNWGMHG